MDKNEFAKKRPWLYHLTDRRNINGIKSERELLCSVDIIKQSDIVDKDKTLRTKRNQHLPVIFNGRTCFIRDQQPISLLALGKCLLGNFNEGDYIYLLNSRVFAWPTIKRLESHFNRYRGETPKIIKFSTKEAFKINSNIEFSRINSGATRANYHLGGIAVPRGPNTFKTAQNFYRNISSVAEVTFPCKCKIPDDAFISDHPQGPWLPF